MKKYVLGVITLLWGTSCLFEICAEVPQSIPLQIINESPISNNSTKAPMRPMYISQDGNILTLPATSVDYTLELRDENGTVVYTDYLPAGTIQVVFPSSLNGCLEIRLVANTYYYIGYLCLI